MEELAPKVDTCQLIEEVKRRPGLYDKSIDIDRDEKMRLWKEVGAAVYCDWEKVTKAQAYDRVLELLKKWRSVRDALNRELRIQKQGKNKKTRQRRVYKYYSRLKFLIKDRQDIDNNDESYNEDEHEYETYTMDACQSEEREECDPLHGRAKISVRKEVKNEKKQKEQSPESLHVIDLPIHYNHEGNDSDRLFLMSFVPELSKLPSHINMWARAEIANVMQQAVNSFYNNSMPGANYDSDRHKEDDHHESIL